MPQHTVTRADLAAAVHRRVGLSLTDSRRLVDVVLAAVQSGIVEDKVVYVHKFGSLRQRTVKPRVARNPQTGAPVPVPARRTVLFRPASALDRALNGGAD